MNAGSARVEPASLQPERGGGSWKATPSTLTTLDVPSTQVDSITSSTANRQSRLPPIDTNVQAIISQSNVFKDQHNVPGLSNDYGPVSILKTQSRFRPQGAGARSIINSNNKQRGGSNDYSDGNLGHTISAVTDLENLQSDEPPKALKLPFNENDEIIKETFYVVTFYPLDGQKPNKIGGCCVVS